MLIITRKNMYSLQFNMIYHPLWVWNSKLLCHAHIFLLSYNKIHNIGSITLVYLMKPCKTFALLNFCYFFQHFWFLLMSWIWRSNSSKFQLIPVYNLKSKNVWEIIRMQIKIECNDLQIFKENVGKVLKRNSWRNILK